MTMYPVVQIGLIMAGVGAVGVIAAGLKSAWKWMPLLLAMVAGLAFAIRLIRVEFLADSLLWDVPWALALPLAAWSAFGAAGMVRVTSWPLVVVTGALFGDVLVGTGLALAEPDPARRARLVIAANGASIMGVASSATTLTLGAGGLDTVLVGLALAAVGFARGGAARPSFHRPDGPAAGRAALTIVWVALLTWLVVLGNVTQFGARMLEGLPPLQPGHATPWLGTVALILGMVGFEPANGLLAEQTLGLATQLRGAWAHDAVRIGLAVGSGIPALLVTGSKVTTGLPLWVAQALLALAYLAWRHHV